MEQLSNEEKKQLFYKLKEMYDSNPGEWRGFYVREEDKIARQTIRGSWEIVNNNGPLGIRYAGKDEQGKNRVQLIGVGSSDEHENSEYIMAFSGITVKSYSDEELSKFLDSFFDMSNMEIINEFIGGNDDIKTFEDMYPYNKERLMYLYALDSLKNNNMNFESSYCVKTEILSSLGFGSHAIESSDLGLELERILIDFEGNYNFNNRRKIDSIEKLSEAAKQNRYLAEIAKILDITSKSMREFPDIWKKIKSGTYKKETPLQQREVSGSEVGEVAEGVSLTTVQNTLGVVTNLNEEPVINNDGQSHNGK